MAEERSRGELNFIDQFTRKLVVDWASVCVGVGELPEKQFSEESAATNPYVAHALAKGWITKKFPRKLTASGWDTAAAFLKR